MVTVIYHLPALDVRDAQHMKNTTRYARKELRRTCLPTARTMFWSPSLPHAPCCSHLPYGCECTYNVHCTYTLLARYSSYKCLKDSFITPREVESKLIIPSRYLILSVEQTITCSKDSFAPIHKIEQFPHSHVGANIKIKYKIKMFPHRGPLYHTTILILCLVGSSAPLRLSSNQSALFIIQTCHVTKCPNSCRDRYLRDHDVSDLWPCIVLLILVPCYPLVPCLFSALLI